MPKQQPQYRIRTLLAVLALFAVLLALATNWYRDASKGVTSVYVNANDFGNGERARVVVLKNALDSPVAVVIHHLKSATERFDSEPSCFQSDVRWKNAYPASQKESGVWIDGKKQSLSGQLKVFYVSGTSKAGVVEISNEDQHAFIQQAYAGGDPVQFVKKWIRPE